LQIDENFDKIEKFSKQEKIKYLMDLTVKFAELVKENEKLSFSSFTFP
jgi:hypothetical protein